MRLQATSGIPSVATQGQPVTGSVSPNTDPNVRQEPAAGEIDPAAIAKAVDRLNQVVKTTNHAVEFQIEEDNRLVIRVMNRNTSEVIQQIPSERLLRVLRSMDELLGNLLDHKA